MGIATMEPGGFPGCLAIRSISKLEDPEIVVNKTLVMTAQESKFNY